MNLDLKYHSTFTIDISKNTLYYPNDTNNEHSFGIKLFNNKNDYRLYAYGLTNNNTLTNLIEKPKSPKYIWMFNNRTGCKFKIKC